MDELKAHRTGWICEEPNCLFVCNVDSVGAIQAHKRQHDKGSGSGVLLNEGEARSDGTLLDIADGILDEIDRE